MAKVRLDSKPVMYSKIGPLTEDSLRLEAEEIAERAEENLAMANSSLVFVGSEQIPGTTSIQVDKISKGSRDNKYSADFDVIMSNPDGGAMAIETGHDPSGKFAETNTRAPRGLYILSRAAGLFDAPRFRR